MTPARSLQLLRARIERHEAALRCLARRIAVEHVEVMMAEGLTPAAIASAALGRVQIPALPADRAIDLIAQAWLRETLAKPERLIPYVNDIALILAAQEVRAHG